MLHLNQADHGHESSIDLICFSHLRWDFVFQRPHHLLSRAASRRRVFFVEEPVFSSEQPYLKIRKQLKNIWVVTPHLPQDLSKSKTINEQRGLVDQLIRMYDISRYVSWYYTPMALEFTRHLTPIVSVYDCMDQLANFKGAPTDIELLEDELFDRVDVAFTGGLSLHELKQDLHSNIHAFPSSVDADHFAKARSQLNDPFDQAHIPSPRLGYIGVIDERIDLKLINEVAALRPEWQIVMVGPLAKISPDSLPRRHNIHYLGGKSYDELPSYLANWEVAFLPFARNCATKFISPTKTPEYLSAGRRVISTSIRDVVRPYAKLGLVEIADQPEHFVQKTESLLDDGNNYTSWLQRVDEFLSQLSWDKTFASMWSHVERSVTERSMPENILHGVSEIAIISHKHKTLPVPSVPLHNSIGSEG